MKGAQVPDLAADISCNRIAFVIMMTRNDNDEFHINYIFPEHHLVSKSLLQKSPRSTVWLIESEGENELSKNYVMKIYKYCDPLQVSNEFKNIGIFRDKCKNKCISAPSPIIFNTKMKMVVTEYINGFTLRKILFSSLKNKNLNRIADLTAIALSEYHNIFISKNDSHLDGNEFVDNLYLNLSKCNLNIEVLPFLDFAPNNIIISQMGQEDVRLYLLDFPGYIFGSSNFLCSPHRDLAYLKHTLDSIMQFPQYLFVEKKRIRAFYDAFLSKYCEEKGVCLNNHDIKIINSYITGWRAQATSQPFFDLMRTKNIKHIGSYLLSKLPSRQNEKDIFVRQKTSNLDKN